MLNLATAVGRRLVAPAPQRRVPLRWLRHRTSRIDRRFAREADVSAREEDGFQIVTINGRDYAEPTAPRRNRCS